MCRCLEKRVTIRRQQLDPMKRRKGGRRLRVEFDAPVTDEGKILEGRFLRKSEQRSLPVVALTWSFNTQTAVWSGTDYVVAEYCPFCGSKLGMAML